MAVYTDVSDDELAAFLRDYSLGDVISRKGIAEGVENSNFLLRTDNSMYLLTLFEKRVDPADLPFFIALMEHLAGAGIACPTPIKASDGKALRQLCGRPAVIVSFLDGLWPRRVQPFHCTGVGDALARLHLAGATFAMKRPNDLSLDGWCRLGAATRGRADEVHVGLADEIAAELDALGKIWPGDLP
ncbi:MAG: phosphotransferase, partial [Stellaceae bacterium]